MKFTDRLTQLLDLFGVSNSRLAQVLGVDPSLVSKWRNGSRYPARNAFYVRDMVHLFHQMYLEADPMIQHRLRRMLGETAVSHLAENDDSFKQQLLDWLDPAKEKQTSLFKENIPYKDEQILQMMQHLMTLEAEPADEVETIFNQGNSGNPGRFYLYEGAAGRRQAVIELLDQILAMEAPQELLLLSQEELYWMMEDHLFMREWNQKLTKVLQRGHRVTIIHHMDRKTDDLLEIMKYWIPLHLTGQVNSWYDPHYRSNLIKSTYFILRDHAAIFAADAHQAEDENLHTFYFKEPAVSQILEQNFRVLQNTCVPLVEFYTGRKMEAYMEQILSLEEAPGTWIGWKNGLSSTCLSVSLYEELLRQAGVGQAARETRLKLQQQRLEAFRQQINHFSYIEILPLKLFNQLGRGKMHLLSPLEGFMEEPLMMNDQQVTSLLESMIERLQQYPNYEIYLVNNQPLWQHIHMMLGYKENHAALAGTAGPGGRRPAVMITGETNVNLVFEGFLDKALDSIPGNYKNRRQVIRKIEKTLARCQKRMTDSQMAEQHGHTRPTD